MTPRALLVAFLASCSLAAVVAATNELESLMKEAAQNFSTDEGRHYFPLFSEAIMPVFSKALDTCGETTPDTKEPTPMVFVVGADGTISRLVYSTDVPFGTCVGSKLRSIKILPKPPRDGWVVALGAANHHHEEQAQEKPQ
jgi:hypothetical protein